MHINGSMTLRKLDAIGVEVQGVDLDAGLDSATFAELQSILHDEEVVLFRNQTIRDEQLVRLARQFGDIQGHPTQKFSPPGFPDILISSNGMKDGEPIGITDIGQFWHTDGSYLPKPYMYTMLYGIEIPTDDNGQVLGDTMFLSATAAFDRLRPEMKQKLDGLRGVYSYDYRYQQRLTKNPNVVSAAKKKENATHPVVRSHPITGKKAIYINEGYVNSIEGLPEAESKPLLEAIFSHLQNKQFQYRHKWQKGDLIIWDNNSTQHNAVPDYKLPQLRLMKRIIIKSTPMRSASNVHESHGC
jgi:taurine dioxygenase